MTPSVFKDSSALRPLLCCALLRFLHSRERRLFLSDCAERLKLLGPEVLQVSISLSLLPLACGSGGRSVLGSSSGCAAGPVSGLGTQKEQGWWYPDRSPRCGSSQFRQIAEVQNNHESETRVGDSRCEAQTPETCIVGARRGDFLRRQMGLILI